MGIFISNLLTTGKRVLDPTSIRGCSLWLDANTGLFDATSGGSAVTVNGDAIARWEDQSGNNRHLTQSTTVLRPTLTTGAINSLNSVSFLSQYLRGGNICALDNKNLYIAFVCKFNSSATNGFETVISRDGGYSVPTPGYYTIRRWDMQSIDPSDQPGKFMMRVNSGVEVDVGLGNYTTTGYNYCLFSYPRNSIRAYNTELTINDIFRASSTVSPDSSNLNTIHNFALGAAIAPNSLTYNISNGTYFNGEICELVIFQREDNLTSRDITGLSRYFRNKWS